MRLLTTWCICQVVGHKPSHYARCLLLQQLMTCDNVLQAAKKYDADVTSLLLADIQEYYLTKPALSPRDVLDAASIVLGRGIIADGHVSEEPIVCPIESALAAQRTLDRYCRDQNEVRSVLQIYPRMSIEAVLEQTCGLPLSDCCDF